jgi:manganese efflux pump family protein
MSTIEIICIGIGLSMDAFAVSICKGLACPQVTVKQMCIAGVWFGGFQMLMPLIGFLLGFSFEKYITAFDHWIAFVLLCYIGANMIREALSPEKAGDSDASFDAKTMFVMAIATSIDALAVGITFAFLSVNIWSAIIMIGCTTFIFSAAGVKIGNIFGSVYKSKAEIAGGIILILIGTKILLEHLGIITFS